MSARGYEGMRSRRALPEPETLVGNCCGCHTYPLPLFKVPGIYRYRCANCFEKETGFRHHMMPVTSTLTVGTRGPVEMTVTEPRTYYVMAPRNGTEMRVGVVVKYPQGWKFIPGYQRSPSRKLWPNADAAVSGRLKTYRLEAHA